MDGIRQVPAQVQYVPVRADQVDSALAVAMGLSGDDVNSGPVRQLRRLAETNRLSIDRQIAATCDGKIVACCPCIASPGKTASVMVPQNLPHLPRGLDRHQVVGSLLKRLAREAGHWQVAIMQCITPPREDDQTRLLAEAGFEKIAELIYMRKPLAAAKPAFADRQMLRWQTYSEETHAAFAETLLASYEGSRDCPALAGLRDVEDILAGHKSCGQFDRRLWLLLEYKGQAAGLALVNRHSSPAKSCELVYMGLVAACRGKGLGQVLMQEAMGRAFKAGQRIMKLAVDADNAPARRLYQRLGFQQTDRRWVWAVLHRISCGSTGSGT